MTPKALKALKGSIKKWEKIVLGTGEDHGSDNCPLCKAFPSNDCKGCPVMIATSRALCAGTAYVDYVEANTYNKTDEAILAARKMLDFLRSLLPKSATRKEH